MIDFPINRGTLKIIKIMDRTLYLCRNGLRDTIFCLHLELPPQGFALDRCDQCFRGWYLKRKLNQNK